MTSDQVLRTGVLFKKGSGTGPFGRKNWKPRYFVLTPSKLTYYTYEDGDLKGEVDLRGCTEQSIEVMPADSMKTGSSASTIWRVAVNGADRRLLVAAGTEMEMNDWVEQFLVAFRINSGKPLLPSRHSMDHVAGHMVAPGAIMNTSMGNDLSRHSITDFQNFASARRSVGSAVRASMGSMPSHEFRLSDELEQRQKAAETQREQAEMGAERQHQEELLLAQQRSQAEERRMQQQDEELLLIQKQQEEQRLLQERAHQRLLKEQEEQRLKQEEEERLLQEQERMEALLEEQRRMKREQHEREREEAEKKLQELEMEEQEKRHEVEVRRHFDEEVVEVEIRRRPMPQQAAVQEPVATALSPVASWSSSTETAPVARSSLIGDAKKDAMARQQAEHNKRKEAALKEHQEQMRMDFLAQQKQQEEAQNGVSHKPVSPSGSPPQSEIRYEPASPARKRTESSSSVEF